jgi:hypothetical protein
VRALLIGGAILVLVVALIVAVVVTGSNARTAFRDAVVKLSPFDPYHPPLASDGDPKLVPVHALATVDAPRSSLPEALYAIPSGSDVVTPQSARAAVLALWELRSDAIMSQSRETLATIETGSALAVDAERGCGCGTVDRFGVAKSTAIAVSHFDAFPASFFAEVDTTLNGSAWMAELVFTRASADQPWRLAFAGGGQPLQGPGFFPYDIGADGFVSKTPADVEERAARLAPSLAKYWQAHKDGTLVPNSAMWEPGALTDEWAATIAVNKQRHVHRGNGLVGYYRYAVVPKSPTFVVALRDRAYLACTPIRDQTTWVGRDGGKVLQTADRLNWGPSLAPGVYRAVIVTDEHVPCFWFSPNSPTVAVNGVAPPDTVATIGIR